MKLAPGRSVWLSSSIAKEHAGRPLWRPGSVDKEREMAEQNEAQAVWWRRIFGMRASVDRRLYVMVGVGLALMKYALDSALVYVTSGELWNPWAYLSPALFVRAGAVDGLTSPTLMWAMALYALPFAWVGLSMSVRRAADAGHSPWLGLGFLLPGLNMLFILYLASRPSRGSWEPGRSEEVVPADLRSILLSVIFGVGLTAAMFALNIFGFQSYGWSLFFATPFVIGVVCAYLINREATRSMKTTVGAAWVSVLASCAAILLFALEGIICLVMAAPITLIMSAAGAALGRAVLLHSRRGRAAVVGLVLCLPFFSAVERYAPEPPLIEVATSVEVNASPMQVWDKVIHFSELAPPPAWVQKSGVAYPIRAELKGEGVGAVRYCEFSTGPFVEPITAWEPGRRLAFDVRAQPLPMEEWSPYKSVHPPHLDGYLQSKRGEFRLIDLGEGRTRLEGSTWYAIDMQPVGYWQLFASALIQQIHLRVLRHVKAEAEGAAQVADAG